MSQWTIAVPDLLPVRAQVQAMLLHPEILASEARTDAACDLLLALAVASEPESVLRAAGALRQACGAACYLPLYRLRRWLEAVVEVRVGDADWAALDLLDPDLDRCVRRWQARRWEMDLSFATPAEIEVEFRWRLAPLPV